MVKLKSTVSQLDLIHICVNSRCSTTEYELFSSLHGTFTKRDHILGYKTHLNKFKRTEVRQSMLSDHNEIKLEINNGKIPGKSQNIWR